GIENWLLHGGSWGSTLLLAYAQRHVERVSEIVINAVTTTRRREIDWLYAGIGRFFPEQWRRFRDHAGDADVVRRLRTAAGRPGPGGAGARGGAVVRVGGHRALRRTRRAAWALR